MNHLKTLLLLVVTCCIFNWSCTHKQPEKHQPSSADILPSWNKGKARQSIIDFVQKVIDSTGKDFIPVADRIAVFDNDGTLWSEQPMYFQFIFAIDRTVALASKHPEWNSKQPFKAAIENDTQMLFSNGAAPLYPLVMATHSGMNTDEFESIVLNWICTAKHPKYNHPYTDLAYKPMAELLQYLRVHGFKTYIVSGGDVDFMRAWAEKVYGIPREQIIGTTMKTSYELHNGTPVIMRNDSITFLDDKEGKAIAIERIIGKRPVAAFGNSDGDLEMFQWTTSGKGARFALIVHHTDAVREVAYDRNSKVGHLDKALDEGLAKGWTIVSMKDDWNKVFVFE
jgi:phosphoserine phosphatase